MGEEIKKMIIIGLIWGSTNALMKKGTLLWDQTLATNRHRSLLTSLLSLLLTWQYSVPFLVNLSASAAFFALLGDVKISVAVPVTNATTFAATAVMGMVLGEEMRVGLAGIGTVLILIGVCICIM